MDKTKMPVKGIFVYIERGLDLPIKKINACCRAAWAAITIDQWVEAIELP